MNRLYPTSRPNINQWGVIFGLSLVFFLAFPYVIRAFGPSATALSVLPVALAGWYLGTWGGVIASLIALGISTQMLISFLNLNWEYIAANGFWPSAIILVLTGLITGRLRQVINDRVGIETGLRLRERYLTLINISTQDILAPVDLEKKYYTLISHLVNLLVADYGHLVIWDNVKEQAVLVASTRQTTSNVSLDSRESKIISSILQNSNTLGIDDAINSSAIVNPTFSEEFDQPPQSIIYIPLVTKDRKLGVIILAFQTHHHFSDEEIYFAELASKQIALALQNSVQEVEIQQRLREANALSDISRALSETERIGLDQVLQRIVDSARELIPETEQAVIHLLDEEEQVLIPRAVTGIEKQDNVTLNMQLGKGVAGQVIAEGITVNIADVENDPRFLRQNNPVKFRSLMVAPVQTGKSRLGTISIQSGKPNAFSSDLQQLLASLGTQAALAIENARLLETTQQGLKEVNALYRITQGLVASLDNEQLMKDVVHLLQQNFGYYQVQIFVIDNQSDELVMRYGSGKIGELLNEQRLPAGAGIVGHAVEIGEPFFTNDVDKVVFYIPHPLLPDTRSELAVPIQVDNNVLGVLDVQHCLPNRFTEHDLQLVKTVARQLAVALQKAELYSDLQTSLQQEKAVRLQLIQSERLALVGRLLASVSHELNNPLQAIQNALFLLNEEKGISSQGRQDLQIVLSETERMAGLIDRLRTSYRSTRVEDMQPVQINNVVEDVYALVATHLRHKNIAFEFHPEPSLPLIAGLPDQIRQVILNLLMNGAEAMPSGGRLIVATELLDNKETLLTVSDTGMGIEPELLPRIFDAFVTGKETGTGLGLTITYDIVHRHNGRIQAGNNSDRGATFKVWFPAQAQEKLS